VDPLLAPDAAADLVGSATFLDVRWKLGTSDGHERYLAGHVPGAAYVHLETDLADPAGDGSRGRHPLPDPERFAVVMRRCGVRADRTVVVYDDVAGTSAARAWWLLVHHGHPDVRLLDGGWSTYVAAGGPVATGEESPVEGDFVAGPGVLPVLDADGAARVARDGVLIDARAPERYRGETEPVDPRAGHIPGAASAPWADNLDAAGRFLPPEQLYRRYAALGAADRPVVAYCGSSLNATHDLLALELAGIDGARLYEGSWSDWSSDPSRPATVGAEP
jgi:thiosulfate/3-mercaptopyruvate sulfurtransferase